mgnify:CR=1 FL=1
MTCTQLTKLTPFFPGYSYHENAEEFAMVWDTYADEAPHSVVHELTSSCKTRMDASHAMTKFMKNALMKS